jgi:hypothetical protein
MKKALSLITAGFFLPSLALANIPANGTNATSNETIPINYLHLPNFIETNCQNFRALKPIFNLDERFYNSRGWGTGATSCKGEVCWSWNEGKNVFDWQLYTSNLPVRIANTERISKSISQTVKNSQSLRKNSNDVISAVQEFLQSSFGTGKEQSSIRERAITESRSQEQSVETNITALFHRFLSMALQVVFPADYPFCFASATDLFFKAYSSNTSKVNDLVEAFVIFQTVRPQDLMFNNEKNFLNRAKFLYLIMLPFRDREQFAWASATLFAKLLEWNEFQDVRKIVDNYIDKVYKKYQLLKSHSTQELLKLDKELAMFKYGIDAQLHKENKTQDLSEIEDRYAYAAILQFFDQKEKERMIKELHPLLDEALKKNDPLLNAKLLKEEPAIVKIVKEKPMAAVGVGAGIIGIGITGIAGSLYLRKKKQSQKQDQGKDQSHPVREQNREGQS